MIARAIGAIAAVALVAAAVGTAPAVAVTHAPTPVVVGNRLVDSSTGATWVPRGVNFPSFEYACSQGWGYSNGTGTDAAASAMASWKITAVRVPLNEGCWTGQNGQPAFGTVAGYRASVTDFVAALNAAGIVAVLDLHWTQPPNSDHYQQYAIGSQNSVAFWTSVATAFAGNRSVMFDLFNEPYSRGSFHLSWQCWASGGCGAPIDDQFEPVGESTYPAVGMNTLVAAVRAAGATQPIMLSGLEYGNDLSHWLEYASDDNQLVAGFHVYGGNTCASVSCWNSTTAAVAARVPIVAGEFGSTDANAAYNERWMTWADAHGVGYLAWAWWDVDSNPGLSLLTDTTQFTPRAPIGTGFKAHLASVPPEPVPTTATPLSGAPSPSATATTERPPSGGVTRIAKVAGRHLLRVYGWTNGGIGVTSHPRVTIRLYTASGERAFLTKTVVATKTSSRVAGHRGHAFVVDLRYSAKYSRVVMTANLENSKGQSLLSKTGRIQMSAAKILKKLGKKNGRPAVVITPK